ncbi:hypothetical protein AaE_002226 [Aphanomyces astaci]|uniref:Uncharacterized protein n=1 Tax=Aphanomyces astaci TaxID=112090 RepID=A0A6A5AP82_APHAT|nr:hypothetical protein AaE_002226 [Aphanomyces astaci]
MSAATKAADDEVKLLVTQTLESQGILGQIKAQLRAAVYNAIHNVTHEPTKSKRDLVATKDASLALQVVVEFLRQFNLQQTLSVLTAEASLTEVAVGDLKLDSEASKANDVPPTAPTSLLGTFPPLQSAPTLTIPTLANDDVAPTAHDGDDDDEDDDVREYAERLRALDASLKAMEAEDDTGTLSKLKASLQHELESKSDDDGHYGSDFEEDFEEDAIASDVEEDDETTAHESDNDAPVRDEFFSLAVDTRANHMNGAFKPSGTDKLVASRAALDAYDYVEDVVRP